MVSVRSRGTKLLAAPAVIKALRLGPVSAGFHVAPAAAPVAAAVEEEVATAAIIGALPHAVQLAGGEQPHLDLTMKKPGADTTRLIAFRAALPWSALFIPRNLRGSETLCQGAVYPCGEYEFSVQADSGRDITELIDCRSVIL